MRLPLVTLQWNAKKIDKSNIFICYIYIIIDISQHTCTSYLVCIVNYLLNFEYDLMNHAIYRSFSPDVTATIIVYKTAMYRPIWYGEKCLWGFKAFAVKKFLDPRDLHSGWSRERKRSIDWLNLVDNPLTFRLCLNCRLAKGSLKHKVPGRDPQSVYWTFSQARKNTSFGNRVSHIFFAYYCVSL